MNAVKISLTSIFLFALSLFLTTGCQKPGPIEIQDDSNLINMKTVETAKDSVFGNPGVDTIGISGSPNFEYYGKLIFTAIRYDLPAKRDSFLNAEVLLLDKSKPIIRNGRTLTYSSLDAGSVVLNIDTLQKLERRIGLPFPSKDTSAGFIYHFKGPYTYSPGASCSWKGTGAGLVGAFEIPFTSAAAMNVLNISPTYISVTEPLTITWACNNPTVNITISRQGNQVQRGWEPVMQLQVRNTKAGVTIPQKILEMLPVRHYQQFLFTFSSDIRFTTRVSGYPDDIMVHCASIHNVLLSVRP